MKPKPYVLITGHGRSGTNWLLEIFDQSRQTHCRNEPNACAGSASSGLPMAWTHDPEVDRKLESAWDEAIARTAWSFGDRDHPIVVDKDHFSGPARRMGLVRLARAKRPRKFLGRVLSTPLREEWPIPAWIVSARGKGSLVPVLKIIGVPHWYVWAMRHRPQAHVLHIVRHPGGYLNSLIKRQWSQDDMEKVARDNRDILARIAAAEPAWAERFGDLDALSPLETELWYWRYSTETIHQAGEGNPQYQLVIYEELTKGPVAISRVLYRGCELDWDDAIEHRIERMSGESQAIAAAWRDKLTAEQVATVEWVLQDSVMREWWGETGQVGSTRAAASFDGPHDGGLMNRLESSS